MTNVLPYEVIVPDSQLGMSLSAGMRTNLETMDTTHPSVATLLRRTDLLRNGFLARDSNSRYGIIIRSGEGKRFFPLTDFQNIEVTQRGIQPVFRQYHTIYFLGTGIGEFLSSALDHLPDPADSTAVRTSHYIFIEPAAELFLAALYFCNFSSLWLSGAVSLCIGPAWREQLDVLLRDKPPASQRLFAIHPVAVNRQIQAEIGRLLEHHADKPVAIWRKSEPKANIAGPTGAQEYRSVFRKNMEALEASGHLYCAPDTKGSLIAENITFAQDPSGSIFILNEHHQKLTLTFGEEELQLLKTRLEEKFSVYNTYLVLGAGDAALLKTILARTVFRGQWSGYEQVVYVIEPSVKLFVLLLHLLDISEYIRRDRLRLFIGPMAFTDFSSTLLAEKTARIPNEFYACCYYGQGGLLDKINAYCQKLEKDAVAEGEAISSNLHAYYDNLPPSYWRDRFHGGTQMTVVGITTRTTSFLQYCTRDLLNGFAQHGHRTFLLIEPDGTSCLSPTEIMRQLYAIKPDIIIMIDHLRDESRWLPKKLPYICWIQDMLPNLVKYHGYSLKEFDFTYVIEKAWHTELRKNATFKDVEVEELTLACNEQVYYKMPGVKKHYDVSYISHLMDPMSTFLPFADVKGSVYLNNGELQLIHRIGILEQDLQKIYQRILEKLGTLNLSELTFFVANQVDNSKKNFVLNLLKDTLANEHSHSVADYLTTGATRFFCHIIFMIKSIPVRLLAAHGFRVAVWGNNWNVFPELADTVSQGIAENGAMINEIQNASKICLNNSGGISFHMRALEILSSGNFMLSRRIVNDGMPITQYLLEGEEIILFDDENDLLKKVEYYLRNEDEREKIAGKAMKKTVEKYSYFGAAGRIIRDINDRINK